MFNGNARGYGRVIGRAVAVAGLVVGLAVAANASNSVVTLPPSARSDYVEYCAGCHGVNGASAPAQLPELKDRVGYFLCTKEGREYIGRLPNVVRAPVADRQALADLMNYMVFEIGGKSAPANANPYQADEIDGYVRDPLGKTSLVKERARIVNDMIKRCRGVPSQMRLFSSTSRSLGKKKL